MRLLPESRLLLSDPPSEGAFGTEGGAELTETTIWRLFFPKSQSGKFCQILGSQSTIAHSGAWYEEQYPSLTCKACDMLSIPAMPASAECERVFHSSKLLLSDRRARMEDLTEASEYLRAAWVKAIISYYHSNMVNIEI